ncbi:MAG: hypothetical protein B6I34_04805 [Anaerolineaceae bacterium 4572_32.1]|nr:MAG: hypothetical protein B6I34_04805 [Anaerolineaceae bacterium 4572_32.1]
MLKDVSILVTGASGFIGPHLVRRLANSGARVACLSLNEIKPHSLPPGVTGHVADLRNAAAIQTVVQAVHPVLVFHLAAAGVTDIGIDPITAIEVNLKGTLNLLAALAETDYRRFVFVGTGHEYGSNMPPFHEDQPPAPTNIYAASKSAAWLFCQMYHRTRGWPVVGVRPFGVYGPGQHPPTFLPALILSALRGHDFAMTAGEQVRDLVYVQDVVEGMVRAATVQDIEGQVFNLCSGEGISLAELALQTLTLMDNPIRLKLGALPYRAGQIWRMVGDNTRAREALNWQPTTSLKEGLRRTIDWITQN